MTHSLKVAQTANLITAELIRQASKSRNLKDTIVRFGGLHPVVVRSASIAHDIGHPPFGHIGEVAIQRLLNEPKKYIPGYNGLSSFPGSFEGNAQTFRIITRLAFREPALNVEGSIVNPGLNLTRATLAATSKYPWAIDSPRPTAVKNKWGAYESETGIMDWCLRGVVERTAEVYGRAVNESRTVEAQIMDWADDIAYAVHDVEDFYRAGIIPLHVIADFGSEFDAFAEYAFDEIDEKLPAEYDLNEVKDLFEDQLDGLLPRSRYDASLEMRTILHGFASSVIVPSTRDVTLSPEGILIPDKQSLVVVEMLKKLTEYYVISRPVLSSSQRGQQGVLASLIAELWRWAYDHYFRSAGVEDPETAHLSQKSVYRSLPPRLVDYIDIACSEDMVESPDVGLPDMILRGVVDYVASLTDAQAWALHSRLAGDGKQSMLDPWLFL